MIIIIYLYRLSWKLLLFSTLTGIVSGVSGAGLAAVIGSGIHGGTPRETLLWAFVGLGLTSLVAKTCSAFSLMHLVHTAILRMRLDLSRQLLNTSFKQLQHLGKPRLMAIFTNDIAVLTTAFQLMPMTFGNAVLIMVCLSYLAWLSWPLFASIVGIMAVGVLLYRMLERHPLKMMVSLREQTDGLYRHFRELIDGSRELQLNAQRGALFIEQVIAPAARSNHQLSVDAGKGYTWADNMGTLMFYVGFGVLSFGAADWFDLGSETVTHFTVVMLFLIGPIAQLMGSLPLLRSAEVSLGKVQLLLENLAARGVDPLLIDPFAREDAPLHLTLRGVCHRYPHAEEEDRSLTLGPFDLDVRAGETLFIVGGNGSGKTTLAMLLLGFYEPEQGDVWLNGQVVTPENLGNYRSRFSAVFSDFHLIQQLLLGDPGDIDGRAAHYLHRLGIAHKVKVAGGNLSSIDLSAGQRKRLALVSAYLEDRPVLLFDEWASDQDPAFKRIFYTELLPELKALGKAVIVITHDNAYFPYADRVVEVDNGQVRVVSTGSALLKEREL